MPPTASSALPPGWLRRRFHAWWLKRHPPTDTLLLAQANIYILPTRAGLMFGVTLLTLLLASINYQLNLGYLLTFLLAGSGAMSMHLAHGTLRGLSLHLSPPQPVFAGTAARLDITLSASPAHRERFGIGLRMSSASDTGLSRKCGSATFLDPRGVRAGRSPALGALSGNRRAAPGFLAPKAGPGPGTLTWCDLPAGARSQVQLSCVLSRRGRSALPAVHIETRFPMGLFRAWAVWRPASQVLVYPRPEVPAAPLPTAHSSASAGSAPTRLTDEGGDTEGIRAYRRGDSLKRVLWKKSVRPLEAGGDLISRDTVVPVQHELWLDWHHCSGLAPEDRLSRLTAWVIAAGRGRADHGLRLPGAHIQPAQGEAHRRRCLETLALWQ